MNTNNDKNLKPASICNCTNLRRASRAITQFYDELLKPSGLKVTQYSLLNHLKRLGPLSMSEFSQAIRLERTTLVRNLKILEKMGLISIVAAKKAHANQVCITGSGLESLEMALPYWQQAQERTKELLDEEELCVFFRALQKIESIVP
ncbi:MarR family winged helix-turn-helix transcriptional regulator [Anaeromusa acidaminophila]|uniref:MarR family winged helix-turn-helix transcriptional regulator n=1 Tax=Anaeromusa acidaminophila TaxID=81464 RepID=UPI00037CB5C9|nr:MarR family winged helix-turn-helix transcriptional regulator [Anaeromusa acidaminophila]